MNVRACCRLVAGMERVLGLEGIEDRKGTGYMLW